jgi:ligand-binding sensor domain-containing protein
LRKIRLFFIITIFLISSSLDVFAVTNYDIDELVSEAVTAIQMDPSGSIWIGTDSGISRFDGLEWTVYRQTNSSLPDNFINCIMPDNNGNIYFGTPLGVAVFDSPRWESPSLSLPGPDVESMILDGNEDIWIGTDSGLARVSDDRVVDTYTMADSLIPNNWTWQVAIDSFQYIWLATGNGVSRFNGTTEFVNYTMMNGLPGNNIKSIAVEFGMTEDTIWAATEFGVGKGVENAFGSRIWSSITSFNGLSDDDVRYVLVDEQDYKWFATAAGVDVLSPASVWQHYNFGAGNLIDDDCNTIAVDNSDNIWIGTSAGVTKISSNATVSFNKILYLNVETLAYVTVNDPDMNLDINAVETVTVNVYSSTDETGINLTLRETSENSGVFSSNTAGDELGFSYDGSDGANRLLHVAKGDAIYAAYEEIDLSKTRTAAAYYNEIAPFDDDVFLDPPCFIASASYEETSNSSTLKNLLVHIIKSITKAIQ